MKDYIKKILGIPTQEELDRLRHEAVMQAFREKEEREKQEEQERLANLSPKEKATESGEPYVEVVNFELNHEDRSYGSFELDWNDEFIKYLRKAGYPGTTDEETVDMWFADVCRNIALETLAQEEADPDKRQDNVRFINRKDIGSGKSEIS